MFENDNSAPGSPNVGVPDTASLPEHEVSDADWAAFQEWKDAQTAPVSAPAPSPVDAPTVIGNEPVTTSDEPAGTVRSSLGVLSEPDPAKAGSQARTIHPDGFILTAEHKAEIVWQFIHAMFSSSHGLLDAIAQEVVNTENDKGNG